MSQQGMNAICGGCRGSSVSSGWEKKGGNLVGVIVSDCVFIVIVSNVPVVFGYQPILRMFRQVNIQTIILH